MTELPLHFDDEHAEEAHHFKLRIAAFLFAVLILDPGRRAESAEFAD